MAGIDKKYPRKRIRIFQKMKKGKYVVTFRERKNPPKENFYKIFRNISRFALSQLLSMILLIAIR